MNAISSSALQVGLHFQEREFLAKTAGRVYHTAVALAAAVEYLAYSVFQALTWPLSALTKAPYETFKGLRQSAEATFAVAAQIILKPKREVVQAITPSRSPSLLGRIKSSISNRPKIAFLGLFALGACSAYALWPSTFAQTASIHPLEELKNKTIERATMRALKGIKWLDLEKFQELSTSPSLKAPVCQLQDHLISLPGDNATISALPEVILAPLKKVMNVCAPPFNICELGDTPPVENLTEVLPPITKREVTTIATGLVNWVNPIIEWGPYCPIKYNRS